MQLGEEILVIAVSFWFADDKYNLKIKLLGKSLLSTSEAANSRLS